MKWAKKAKTTPLMTPLTKNPKHKIKKKFFIADSKTCKVFWGFKQLSSAIGRGAMDLQRHVQTAVLS